MSYSFRIHVPCPVMMAALRAQIGDPRWRVVDHHDDEDDEPDDIELVDGARWLIYLAGASSRGVAVRRDGASVEVRLNLCASVADHELAVDLATALARHADQWIAWEATAEPIAPTALQARRAGWVAEQVAWAPAVAASMVDAEGATYRMPGPRRDFSLGPRFLAGLRASGAALEDALLAAMVTLQNLDAYYPAMALALTGGATTTSHAVWGPRSAYLFHRVDTLVLRDDDNRLVIPWACGPEVAGDGWCWRDEVHATVERTDADGWRARLARARAVALPA